MASGGIEADETLSPQGIKVPLFKGGVQKPVISKVIAIMKHQPRVDTRVRPYLRNPGDRQIRRKKKDNCEMSLENGSGGWRGRG